MVRAGVIVKARKDTHLEARNAHINMTTRRVIKRGGLNSLDVLVPVGHRNRRQTLLGLDRPGDIVVGDVEIRRDVRRLEGLHAELGLALLLLRDRDGVGRRLSVHGCESSVGHLDRCVGGDGK